MVVVKFLDDSLFTAMTCSLHDKWILSDCVYVKFVKYFSVSLRLVVNKIKKTTFVEMMILLYPLTLLSSQLAVSETWLPLQI